MELTFINKKLIRLLERTQRPIDLTQPPLGLSEPSHVLCVQRSELPRSCETPTRLSPSPFS